MNILSMIQQLGEGFLVTVEIFVLTLVFAMPLGMLVAFGRMSKNPILSTLMKGYISIMRGTPLMLQLLVIYYFPGLVFHNNIVQFQNE